MGLNDLFYHTTVGGEVEKQLRDFNISLRLRLPPVIAWIKQNHESSPPWRWTTTPF